MAVVQGMKKTHQMKKMSNLCEVFTKRFSDMLKDILASINLKDLLSSSKTKQGLTKDFSDCLLIDFNGSLIVVQGKQARGSNCLVPKDVVSRTKKQTL